MAAVSAEFEVCGIWLVTLEAEQFQLGAALPAEFHSRWILKLTLPALHRFPREPVEGGWPVRQLSSERTQHEEISNDDPCS